MTLSGGLGTVKKGRELTLPAGKNDNCTQAMSKEQNLQNTRKMRELGKCLVKKDVAAPQSLGERHVVVE